jgi:hypothetical protein
VKTIGKLALFFSVASAFCFADTWTGKLMDLSCKARAEAGTTMDCTATAATRVFAIELPDGKIFNLDNDGNLKAAEAVKDTKSTDMRVSITGALDDNGGVKVESLRIQE